MKEVKTNNGQVPLRIVLLTGAALLLLAVAGTVWFGLYQSRQLRSMATTQSAWRELVECRASLSEINDRIMDKRSKPGQLKDMEVRFQHARLRFALLASYEGVRKGSLVVSWLQNSPQNPVELNRESLRSMLYELDDVIAQTGLKISMGSEKIVNSFYLYLGFVFFVLVCSVFTGGRLLISSYRHSLEPLTILAKRLSQMNRNIPESLHDTAEATQSFMTDTSPSPEIRYVAESVASLCRDIEEKNKKLDEIYIRDEKTSLYNYRHFKEHLIIDVERAKRSGSPISLAMIDIDYFKRYNDSYGHIAGDRVLAKIADIIRDQCRITDIPSRFGGEEFAVLFPKTGRETTREIADRLRQVISDEPFDHEKTQPGKQLTVSIGIACYPDDASDWYTLINNADSALYQAKSNGRNQVVAFSSILRQQEQG